MGECWCADYDCAGECCGFGKCTCSTDQDEREATDQILAQLGVAWVPPVVDARDISLYDAVVQPDTQDGPA